VSDPVQLDRLRDLASVQDERLAARSLAGARDRFLASATSRRRRFTAPAGAAFVAAAAAIVLFFFLGPRSRALSFEVAGRRGDAGASIAAFEAPLPIRFSDGTALTIAPSGRARVIATEERGGRVLLERGHLDANVAHTGASAWRFDGGPFEVLVTGTRFELGWDPATEKFSLRLDEGSVSVSGPVIGAPRQVVAGETLEVSCREQRFALHNAARAAVVESPLASAGPSAEAPSAEVVAPPIEPAPRRPSWRELAKGNHYREAMDAAEVDGFDGLVDSAAADDLLLLADVARFSGKSARAAEAFTAARRRFPGSSVAAKAAFQLGRLAFDHGRAYAEADRWFSNYLAEQPGGTFAEEALGRLVECREASGGPGAARETAERYLKAYPTGPHAELARRLTEP
jgi:transmembrane sensor